jgi:hypothetical protein
VERLERLHLPHSIAQPSGRASPPDQGTAAPDACEEHRRHDRPSRPPAPRICAHVAPVLCQDLLADALSAAASSEDRCKGGCSLGQPFDPVSIPHDIENRGAATRIDQERNPQVSGASNVRRRSRDRPGSTSQGGDTGSNPVGTTRAKCQVRGLRLNRSTG